MAQAQQMEKMLMEKKYSELLQMCKERLDFFPEDVDSLFYYASALHALGKYKEAKNAFAKLFTVTKDRLFLICEAMPEFLGNEREEAVALLKKETEDDDKVENLIFVFRVAIKNGELEVADAALKKAFFKDGKKTLDMLQEIVEKSGMRSIQMRKVFIILVNMLRRLESPK